MTISIVNTWIRKLVASLCFVGYLPASGTFASAVVVVALFAGRERLGFLHDGGASVAYWILCVAMIALSLVFSAGSKGLFGKDDSGKIVIDEVAGMLITFLFVPLTVRTLIAGFFLFRFFDIVKPFPVNAMEQLDDGVGVTMDDVVAGVLANISLLGILFAYHAVKGYIA